MCGITGKVVFSQNAAVKEADILAMNRALAHRGPDDEGIYISKDKKVGLGQRRLAIVDLSPLGHQPMSYLDRYWLVFNGEIYNFLESRSALENDGYTFTSKTDTEVIAALYDKYGPDCLKYLRGMFAFVIYDLKEQRLFGARDRVGKKPFKYYLNDRVFIFASELKAILTQKEYQKEPDYQAINHFLTLQYCPAPLTGFKGIKKLPPAHYFTLDLKSGAFNLQRYWRLDYCQKLISSENEWKERILGKLEESVRLRMVADVPLGAFLSGGIDSSAIVALMSKLSSTPVKTFSIGFAEQSHNELPYAKIIAEKYATQHTEFIVKPDALDVLPKLVEAYEEPYADSSAIPTYYVSKLTREHVTVALNGDGGDENFAGYTRYSIHKLSLLYQHLGLVNRHLGLPLSRLLARQFPGTLTGRLARFTETMQDPASLRFTNYLYHLSDPEKEALLSPEFRQRISQAGNSLSDPRELVAAQFGEANTPDLLDQALYADFNTYLPDDLLPKVDIATMQVALEGRSPFLDHELLELTAQIPFALKLKGIDNKKHILKKALEGLVPHEVMYRPKRGFSVPVEKWFRGELKEFLAEQLLSDRANKRQLFNQTAVKDLFEAHVNAKANYSAQLWSLLMLELWFQTYFD